MTLSGCAIVPVNREYGKYFDESKFEDHIYGQVEIIEDEGYCYHAWNIWSSVFVKWLVKREMSRSNWKNIESGNDLTLRLKYHLCVKTGDFPTESFSKNIAIAIFTVGIWNSGEFYNCQVDLDVVDRTTGKSVGTYSSVLPARRSNSIMEFMVRSQFTSFIESRVALPTRDVLRQYTVDSKAGKYGPYRAHETLALSLGDKEGYKSEQGDQPSIFSRCNFFAEPSRLFLP